VTNPNGCSKRSSAVSKHYERRRQMASLARRKDRGDRWQATYKCTGCERHDGRDYPKGCAWHKGPHRHPPEGEHAKLFDRKTDAEKWLAANKSAVDTGTWIDPNAGKLTFKVYAEKWREAQVHRDTTRAQVETHLRRHVYPTFGDKALASIRRSDVQAWVTATSQQLAPSTVRVVYSFVAAVLRAAVDDRLIAASPCSRIALPKIEPKRVEPLPTEVVEATATEVPSRFRALVMLAAGTGVRQGEALGLTVDRVDFLRRTVTIDRQLVTMPGRDPYLAPPKTEKSHRVIPLPQVVVDALAAHLAAFAAGPDGFLFTTEDGLPIRRTWFSAKVWRPAAKKVLKAHAEQLEKVAAEARKRGETVTVAPRTEMTFHDLRHYYASLLIRHGESVKTVQARLGHANAAETLDVYSHLWPDSDDRTREAIDGVLGHDDTGKRQAQ
jgi:integrase